MKFGTTVLTLALVLTPAIAFAQSDASTTATPTPTVTVAPTEVPAMQVSAPVVSEPVFVPRVRFGIGFHGGINYIFSEQGTIGLGVLGLYSHLGVQFTERLGLDLEGSGGFFLFTGYARGAVLIDYNVADVFSIAGGPMVGANFDSALFGGARTNSYFGGAARATVYLRRSRSATGVRQAFTLSIEGDVGAAVTNAPGPMLGGYLLFGYARY